MSTETSSPTPSEPYASSAGLLRPDRPCPILTFAIDAQYRTPIALLEYGAAISDMVKEIHELGREAEGSFTDMTNFARLATYPKGSYERTLYDGEHVEPTDYLFVMTQGFSPPTKDLLKVAEEKLLRPSRNFVKGYPWSEGLLELGVSCQRTSIDRWVNATQKSSVTNSTDMMVPLGRWFERWGNTVRIGIEQDNTLQTEDLFDLVDNVREYHEEFPDKKIVLFGVSAGGMDSELAADILLQKHGILVDWVITAGSPEISPVTTAAFNNMTQKGGLGGLIHLTAQECMNKDPQRGRDKKLSRMQEIMAEYANSGRDPMIKKMAYQAQHDPIVPGTFSPNAIIIPGHHATLAYTKEFMQDVSERVLSAPRL